MTTEAALTKLMVCLHRTSDLTEIRQLMMSNLRGELTRFSSLT